MLTLKTMPGTARFNIPVLLPTNAFEWVDVAFIFKLSPVFWNKCCGSRSGLFGSPGSGSSKYKESGSLAQKQTPLILIVSYPDLDPKFSDQIRIWKKIWQDPQHCLTEVYWLQMIRQLMLMHYIYYIFIPAVWKNKSVLNSW